ncbi:class I SAM-dependent methyltransferase [Lunatibacter salilacus]|uniref:class I SAM-dependent methyltransferase n=1 Tax=Lunatibacter salilacus TaxID=2483804 RepID=UPI00131AB3F8|nr:class I SAM-dependent methyltransferase [Lunatibacter salilacus]
MTAIKACWGCGNTGSFRYFKAFERMYGLKQEFLYFECPKCRSIQIDETPENLGDFYSTDYYAFTPLNRSSPIKIVLKKWRWKLFKSNIIKWKIPEYYDWIKNLNILPESKIADIGCGNGQLLYEMRSCGFTNLYGYDPFLQEEYDESGLKMIKTDFMSLDLQFDAVMLHHSFEHMSDPTKVMEKLSTLLKKGGELLVRVPVSDSQIWQEEDINWFQLDAPRHLFIPSVRSLKAMGDKFGLKLKKLIFDSNEFQILITKHYKKGGSLVNFSIESFTSEEITQAMEMAKKYNEKEVGDQACFYFEKL